MQKVPIGAGPNTIEYLLLQYLQPAVNRQPGFRRGGLVEQLYFHPIRNEQRRHIIRTDRTTEDIPNETRMRRDKEKDKTIGDKTRRGEGMPGEPKGVGRGETDAPRRGEARRDDAKKNVDARPSGAKRGRARRGEARRGGAMRDRETPDKAGQCEAARNQMRARQFEARQNKARLWGTVNRHQGFHPNGESIVNLTPAVNRQPGFRREDS